MRVTAQAEPECVRPLRNAVAKMAGDAGASDAQVSIIKLCVSEAIANAVKHAYPEGESGPVEIAVRKVRGELLVAVADRGCVHGRRTPRPQSGLGLAFVERLTDGCTFTATSRGTTVEMAFALSRPAQPRLCHEPGQSVLIDHRRMTAPTAR